MVLTDNEIEKILLKHGLKKDVYGFIKYSDEILLEAKINFGNILNRTSIITIINKFKDEVEEGKNTRKLKSKASLNKFLEIIVDKLGLFKTVKIMNEYRSDYVNRYIVSDTYVSPYEIALSLLSHSFLSHYSAMYVHDLTINKPKDIYINREQSKKSPYSGDGNYISQGRIDYAFSKKMRRTNMIYSFSYDDTSYKVHVLNSKNTHNTGVITKEVLGFSKPIKTTNVERTLIDAMVRPGYSGGVSEILDAFIRAENINIKKIWEYLEKFNHSYPYYKSLAFYLKNANYDYKSEFEKYKSDPRNHLTFYLDYQMINPKEDKRLGLLYPRIIDNISDKH